MKVTIARGETLAEALTKYHIEVEQSCGGNGTCGRCKVRVEGFGVVKACRFRLAGNYEVTVPQQRKFTAASLAGQGEFVGTSERKEGEESPLIAIDVGTTTVALWGSFRGKTVEDCFVNPQRKWGADVMSRIRYANERGVEKLQESICNPLRQHIETMIQELEKDVAEGASESCRVMLAANTTMQHLISGFSCEGLGQAPFSPVSLAWRQELWKLPPGEEIRVTMFPGISTFIGADVVSGIYATGLWKEEEPVLLVDLGTNGEMALGCKGRILTASAAAGPAFEGSDLAVQIHGAGVLRCIHRMLADGIIDETGLLADPYFEEGFPVGRVLEEMNPTGTSRKDAGPGRQEVRMTQEDIRQIQMAKAAVRAGVDILLQEYGISPDEVKRVYLAGGMGYFLNPEDAFGVGLLPGEFWGKTYAAGNTSLLGALAVGQQGEENARPILEEICSRAEEILLAEHPFFAECYVENMNFPAGDENPWKSVGRANIKRTEGMS